MTRYVEFELEDGGTVIVEAGDELTGGLVKAATPGEMVEKAKDSFSVSLFISWG